MLLRGVLESRNAIWLRSLQQEHVLVSLTASSLPNWKSVIIRDAHLEQQLHVTMLHMLSLPSLQILS